MKENDYRQDHPHAPTFSKYREPVFDQEVVLPKVPGRKPNKEVHEAIARLPVYVQLLDRLAKLAEKWASEDDGKLPF